MSDIRHRKAATSAEQANLPPMQAPNLKESAKNALADRLNPARKQPVDSGRNSRRTWVIFWLFWLSFAAVLTRFWHLNHPAEVVFDEVHFGKFASYYLRRTYYFDVHPPLGKLLTALSGKIAGYDGSYLFDKIGEDYASRNVPFVMMRAFSALFGAALVPLVFLILIESGHSIGASIVGASMALFDNALTTQSRLILLDSYLIFFDVLSVYAWIKFYKQRFQPYSAKWWSWLCMTGLSIALTTSVKLVGLFIVALIGLATLHDLWRLIDIRRKLTTTQCVQHFMARAVTLIALPIVIYLGFFAVHFTILNRSGPGDSFMSPAFQASLLGNRFNKDSRSVPLNASISLLHYKTNCYLHSHSHNYPLRYDDDRVSSQGQQITGYPHADSNNHWRLIPADDVYEVVENGVTQPRYLKNGDIVQLEHVNTKRWLLTHDVASPLTPTHMEMTAIVPDESRRNETLWRIEVEGGASDAIVGTIDAKLKLINVQHKVALSSHKKPYGEWGFGQQEVNGNKNHKQKTNTWVVDDVVRGETKVLRSAMGRSRDGFFAKFLELQYVMLRENAALVAEHPYQSQPGSWPALLRGISFWIKAPDQQIYLIGNPLVWWGGLFSLGILLMLMLLDAIAMRRGIDTAMDDSARRRLFFTGGFFLGGWALHYLPFFIMGRALFLHHYLPALMFTFMVSGTVFDFATRFESKGIRTVMATSVVAALGLSFYYFSPLTYGLPLGPEQVEARRLLPGWDYHYGAKL